VSPAPSSFTFEPLFAIAAVAVGIVWRRACRREADVPWWRIASFLAGLALVAGALNSPLETIAIDYLVLFHLLQNVMIGDWAPVLLLVGLTPAMRESVLRRGGAIVELVTRPFVALPVWVVTWYVVHLGPVYDAAVTSTVLLHVEHAVLILTGLVFWWPVLVDEPHRVPTLGRIAYVFAAFVGTAFLGIVLTFAPPLYSHYENLDVRLWGISAAADQNLGGVLMSTEQAVVFGAALVWLLIRLFREESEAEERLAAEQRAAGLRRH
jgi:putative membrane protein